MNKAKIFENSKFAVVMINTWINKLLEGKEFRFNTYL